MNRRDFLGLFRGLAVLPFVKLPELPAATEALTDAEVEGIRREYEGLRPDASHIRLGHLNSGVEITSGQAVYIDEYTGKLGVWNGQSAVAMGIAARDIAPGEVVEWRIGGNSKDIVTSGVTRVKFTY